MRNHEGPTLDTIGDYTVIDCQGCRFAHVVPAPDADTLRQFYESTYYEQTKPDYFRHAEEDRGWWGLVYEERLVLLERWLNDDTRRKLLDVGSGPGLFLMEARRRGWDAEGVEPSAAAVKHSRHAYGVTVYQMPFEEFVKHSGAEFGPRAYDAVMLAEVLEHVPDPFATLHLATRMLRPGGYVCIVVPNDYSILQAALEAQRSATGHEGRWWLAPPAHLNYFNVRSLHGLVRQCGYAVADVTCTFPMELFVMMGHNYIGDDVKGREAHAMRKRLEMALEVSGLGDAKRQLYRELARRGIGRDIVMLARKPEVEDGTARS